MSEKKVETFELKLVLIEILKKWKVHIGANFNGFLKKWEVHVEEEEGDYELRGVVLCAYEVVPDR